MIAHLAALRDQCELLMELGAGMETTPEGTRKPTPLRGALITMIMRAEDEIARLTPYIDFPGPERLPEHLRNTIA